MRHPEAPAMRAAAMANPDFMRRWGRLTTAAVREAVEPLVGNLISQTHIERMVQELVMYKDVYTLQEFIHIKDPERLQAVIAFWQEWKKILPARHEYAMRVFLLQPSSACVGRAFSILNNIYHKLMTRMLNDYFELQLQLRFSNGVL